MQGVYGAAIDVVEMSDECCNSGAFALRTTIFTALTRLPLRSLQKAIRGCMGRVPVSTQAQHANPEHRPRIQVQHSLSPVEGPQRMKRALKLIYSPTLIEPATHHFRQQHAGALGEPCLLKNIIVRLGVSRLAYYP